MLIVNFPGFMINSHVTKVAKFNHFCHGKFWVQTRVIGYWNQSHSILFYTTLQTCSHSIIQGCLLGCVIFLAKVDSSSSAVGLRFYHANVQRTFQQKLTSSSWSLVANWCSPVVFFFFSLSFPLPFLPKLDYTVCTFRSRCSGFAWHLIC